MLVLDRAGVMQFANRRLEEMLGYGPNELSGQAVERLLPERLRAQQVARREAVFEGPPTSTVNVDREVVLVRRDGLEVAVEMGLNPLEVAGQKYLLASLMDVTEHRTASERFRLAIEASPAGMLMVDAGGTIVLVNARIETMFGYRRDELLGQPVELLLPARFRGPHLGLRRSFVTAPSARMMGAGRDLFGLRRDGSELPMEIGLNPIDSPDGLVVLCAIIDITDRLQHREALEARLAEREVLLHEVHHRVKNNLQLISSLISLQSRQQPHAKAALDECRARIESIALVHERLHQTADARGVPFSSYVRSLVSNIVAAMAEPTRVRVAFELDEVSLALERAVPCGLLLNELVTNVLKHAFPGEQRGQLIIRLSQLPTHELRLEVCDDGVGLPASVDVATARSVGLVLVSSLAEQLDASLEVSRVGGTTFSLVFGIEAP